MKAFDSTGFELFGSARLEPFESTWLVGSTRSVPFSSTRFQFLPPSLVFMRYERGSSFVLRRYWLASTTNQPFCSLIKKTSRTTSSNEVKVSFQVLPPSSVLSTVPLPPAAQPRSELIKKTERSHVIVPAVCLLQLPSCAVVVAATTRHRTA